MQNKYRIIIHAKKNFAVLVISEKQKAETFKNKCSFPAWLSVPAIRIVDKPLLISRERIVQPPRFILKFYLQFLLGEKSGGAWETEVFNIYRKTRHNAYLTPKGVH
ncbi:MAG: hypothetical protein CRN43_01925 [Candidatus Nephrothrix sp. EaCA]|nr:MAG: hypothetical protein CRN43_01925 [Candidatus Nephrothrix sp. EaCA]